ncbi:MAG: hypothetical protein KAU27_16040 [Desulfuromonadales bacterium]|nr:hypothetical protein [Desulfuromonadales bacterium]
MHTNISLDCPYCGESIYESLEWFKKSYSTCPSCDEGLVAGQFTAMIAELEQEMDANIEEMVNGQPNSGCCGKKSTCGGGC